MSPRWGYGLGKVPGLETRSGYSTNESQIATLLHKTP